MTEHEKEIERQIEIVDTFTVFGTIFVFIYFAFVLIPQILDKIFF